MGKHRTRRRGAATSRRCTACDSALRTGKARRAWVMSPDGELVYGLVCNRCALRALAFDFDTSNEVTERERRKNKSEDAP